MSICCQIIVKRFEKQLIAKLLSQHVKNRSAAGISVVIKHRILIGVVFRHYWTTVSLVPRAKYLIVVRANVRIKKFFVTFEFLVPHRLHVSREALIQPDLAPISASDVIAKPLVSEFMGLQRFAVIVEQFALIVDHFFDLGCCRNVFHTSAEILDKRLRIFWVWIFDAGYLREKVYGSRKVFCRCGYFLNVIWIAVIYDRCSGRGLLNWGSICADDRSQVIRVRLVHLPIESSS